MSPVGTAEHELEEHPKQESRSGIIENWHLVPRCASSRSIKPVHDSRFSSCNSVRELMQPGTSQPRSGGFELSPGCKPRVREASEIGAA